MVNLVSPTSTVYSVWRALIVARVEIGAVQQLRGGRAVAVNQIKITILLTESGGFERPLTVSTLWMQYNMHFTHSAHGIDVYIFLFTPNGSTASVQGCWWRQGRAPCIWKAYVASTYRPPPSTFFKPECGCVGACFHHFFLSPILEWPPTHTSLKHSVVEMVGGSRFLFGMAYETLCGT